MSKLEMNGTLTLSFASSDRTRAAQWYADHLGFETMFDAAELGWLEMQTPIAGVTIGFSENLEVQAGGCVPVFGVDDVDAARAQLEAANILFDGETEEHDGMVKLATFFDPDGNALMLAQDLTG